MLPLGSATVCKKVWAPRILGRQGNPGTGSTYQPNFARLRVPGGGPDPDVVAPDNGIGSRLRAHPNDVSMFGRASDQWVLWFVVLRKEGTQVARADRLRKTDTSAPQPPRRSGLHKNCVWPLARRARALLIGEIAPNGAGQARLKPRFCSSSDPQRFLFYCTPQTRWGSGTSGDVKGGTRSFGKRLGLLQQSNVGGCWCQGLYCRGPCPRWCTVRRSSNCSLLQPVSLSVILWKTETLSSGAQHPPRDTTSTPSLSVVGRVGDTECRTMAGPSNPTSGFGPAAPFAVEIAQRFLRGPPNPTTTPLSPSLRSPPLGPCEYSTNSSRWDLVQWSQDGVRFLSLPFPRHGIRGKVVSCLISHGPGTIVNKAHHVPHARPIHGEDALRQNRRGCRALWAGNGGQGKGPVCPGPV